MDVDKISAVMEKVWGASRTWFGLHMHMHGVSCVRVSRAGLVCRARLVPCVLCVLCVSRASCAACACVVRVLHPCASVHALPTHVQFEEQFDQLDVQTQYVEGALNGTHTCTWI